MWVIISSLSSIAGKRGSHSLGPSPHKRSDLADPRMRRHRWHWSKSKFINTIQIKGKRQQIFVQSTALKFASVRRAKMTDSSHWTFKNSRMRYFKNGLFVLENDVGDYP